MDSRFPRLTRSLRAFSRLDRPNLDLAQPGNYIEECRRWKAHQAKSETASWSDMINIIEEDVGNKFKSNLHDLRTLALEIIGGDQRAEVTDEAAAFLLTFYIKEPVDSQAHLQTLKLKFGLITWGIASKICKLVSEMRGNLSDDCIVALLGEKSAAIGTRKCFGKGIKYSASKQQANLSIPVPETRRLQDMAVNLGAAGQVAREFSMKYDEPLPAAAASKEEVKNEAGPSRKNGFGKNWLEKELKKYYEHHNPSGLSMSEFSDMLVNLLNSPKSSDELQDEIFSLLGFHRFELIQVLLQHRQEIVISQAVVEEEKRLISTGNQLSEQKRPNYGCQIVVQSDRDKLLMKQARKEEKKINKIMTRVGEEEEQPQFNPMELRAKRLAALKIANTESPFGEPGIRPATKKVERYPFVYDSQKEAQQSTGFIAGVKLMLPVGLERVDNKMYEEVNIPIAEQSTLTVGNKLVEISSLDDIGRMAFQGVTKLNRIQSIVFNTAYNTNENLLICAPTGAGKTNVAMLSVLHTIRQFIQGNVIKRDEFKIVYVAPMKALAAEMTANFGKKLQCLGITVKELTGDMQLTKAEILQTQMLVTTPEKWDVVTRKGSGDIALTQIVKLLIIDEVHLLHGDRGPVVEALVARTLRLVESSQSMIRIVGLSATLPNYVDVANFLRVNLHKGLFYFDSRFRPVPLSTTFVGVKAVKSFQQMNDMDLVCYEKVYDMVSKGHQVMVFVHARNATVKTAMVLKEFALQRGQSKAFEAQEGSAIGLARKAMARSRNKQMAELFPCGFSIHHAGMLRGDRSMVEKYFGDGLIKVLVCTSTLAWGVNLPAHAVIIKGTEIYDSKHGAFVDLGILDVLQIFGRAGRPQFDQSGHGVIITSHDKLSHYLSLLTNQFPIESNFIDCLADNLNAEITLGTVSNVEEAVEWLSYTYLFVRMRLNPHVYGINYDEVADDSMLRVKRNELIRTAALRLDKAHMIRFNERTGDLSVTDLGRTASHFYIKYNTVETFNELMHDIMNESSVLSMISQAQEFEQLKVRDDELDELDELTDQNCEVHVAGGSENLHGKVNILLQTYLSRGRVNSFSLISDLGYITQNAVRICRALFDIVLRKNNPMMAGRFLKLSQMFEQQQWDSQTPLRQFHCLPAEIIVKIEEKKLTVDKIRYMDSREIGNFLRHDKMGQLVKKCADEFPLVEITASLQPITRTVLRIRLQIVPKFRWNDKVHGKTSESFYIWIEDSESNYMYHSELFLMTKKQVMSHESQDLVMTIPLTEPLPPQYYVRVTSDRWLGSTTVTPLSFQHLILPDSHPPHTDLLNLQPLPVTALNDAKLEMLYNFTHFNPIQTQIFHCLYHTDNNVLLGAPTGSGKTIAAEIAMFRVFKVYPKSKVVYIAPLKALVRERIKDWKVRLESQLNRRVVELTGDITPDARAIAAADVIVTTPEKWDGISRSWQTRNYVRSVALIVIDEIHLLGEDRGPVLEVIVSRTNFIASHTTKTLRIVGLSTALANAKDLANWLNIGEMGLYNFRPSVRPVPLEVHIQGFPGKHYCPRMATMNRPTFQAIRQFSPGQPALVFVSSRRQTRLTALDLIAYLGAEENHKQWLHLPEEEMEQIVTSIKDVNLKLTLAFGIGIHHAGLQERDRQTVEELFVNQKIQVLIATATLAWGVNFPAHLVVIKGTEFFDGKTHRYVDMPITDVLQMMGRAGRPQYDDVGFAVVLVHDVKKNFYKKFLYEPFPVESSLLQVMPDHFNAEIVAGTIQTKQDVLDYLTWTYFFRRLLQNPTYYELETVAPEGVNRFLSELVEGALHKLYQSHCISYDDDERTVHTTSMGRIASYYYLSHKTMHYFTERLSANLSSSDVLSILCGVHEYAELPVRHNEDIQNEELAKLCPIKVDPSSYDSPHTKAHLLLQAHFSRVKLPNTDYLTDLKSVMDQTIRVMQALIDVCAERGWLATTLRVQQLMQMVVQGRWASESPLLTLPHFEQRHVALLEQAADRKAMDTLPGLKAACRNPKALGAAMKGELNGEQLEQVHRVLNDMPALSVEMSVRGWWGDLGREGEKVFKQPPGREDWLRLHADQEYTLMVRLRRLNRSRDSKAHCPRFPKGKDEGWFLSLGSAQTGDLKALKRVAGVRGNHTSCQQLSFRTPFKTGLLVLTLYVMSDCYLGLDQQYDLQMDVIPADLAAQVNSEIPESAFHQAQFSDDDDDFDRAPPPLEGAQVW